jgi:AbrB family transcriptional regulator (stage V sporulation protein T)
MKATGIVRRIDDLGRVVIPKEIRRTLRIREGDPLEIYTDSDGEVIFKKYSPVGEMAGFTAQYAEVLHRSTNLPAVICDRDHIIAAAGIAKKDALEKRVSPELENLMETRGSFIANAASDAVKAAEGVERNIAVAYPIIGAGDVSGAVVLLWGDAFAQLSETEIKLAQVTASFLGKQMEE